MVLPDDLKARHAFFWGDNILGVWSTRQFHFPPFPWWKINFKKFLFKKETKRTHNTRAAELQNDNFGMTAFSL